MRLTEQAISLIRNIPIRLKLCKDLGVIDQTIMDYIRANKTNGPLTTYTALKIIREETGLSDSQLLEDISKATAKQNKRTAKKIFRKPKNLLNKVPTSVR